MNRLWIAGALACAWAGLGCGENGNASAVDAGVGGAGGAGDGGRGGGAGEDPGDGGGGHATADCSVSSDVLYLEAEAFDGPWPAERDVPGYRGTGFVFSTAGGTGSDTMTTMLTIPEAGSYRVWARAYADGLERQWQLSLDGQWLAPTHQGDASAGGFVWQLAGTVELEAGPTEMRLGDVGYDDELVDAIALGHASSFDARAEEQCWEVLDPAVARPMMLDELVARARAHHDALAVPGSAAAWDARASTLRAGLRSALGLEVPLTTEPVTAEVVGSTPLDGYRIERIIFESLPGFAVSANVYVPDGDGPFPVMVSPVGHWWDGKSDPTPAARSHALAKLGFLSITWDPFGLGERMVVGNSHDEHWRLVLTGHTNAGLHVWETMRAMDYVLARPDADPTRVAMTGASGGGLATVYASPLETRHQVAVPVVYVTEYEDFIATGKWHCGCSHVPGLGGFTDMGEIVGLLVPRPTLIINALSDSLFPPLGAQRAEEQARPSYELFDAGDRLVLDLFSGGHDYSRTMRERMYGWVERYLNGQGDGSALAEPSFAPLPPGDPATTCFPDALVPDSYDTVRDLAWQWAVQASAALPGPESIDRAGLLSELERLVHPPEPQEPVVEHVGTSLADGHVVERLRIVPTAGVALAGRLLRAETSSAALVVVDGSRERLLGWSAIVAAHEAGLTVLHVSLRGQVETEWAEYQTVADDMLLGDPLLGQRAFDVVQSVRALRTLLGSEPHQVGVIAADRVGALSGLVAQALWGELDALAVGPLFGSWLSAFDREDFPMMAHVSGILLSLDMPQLVALATDRPLRIVVDDDALLAHYPGWPAWIEQHADVRTSYDVEQVMPWMAEQLLP